MIALVNLYFITAGPKFETIALQITGDVFGFFLDCAVYADGIAYRKKSGSTGRMNRTGGKSGPCQAIAIPPRPRLIIVLLGKCFVTSYVKESPSDGPQIFGTNPSSHSGSRPLVNL